MKGWRLVWVDERDAAWNMAIDEAMLIARVMGEVPDTLRLYRFKPSAVTIGYFQEAGSAIDQDECKRMGVDVVRRITGGGALYHDYRGEITYSIVASFDTSGIPINVMDSYERVCIGLIYALGELGVSDPEYRLCDAFIGGRKVSGSAQARRGKVLLQHGTLMYSTDIITWASVMKVPRAASVGERLDKLKRKLITIKEAIGREYSPEEVAEAMVRGFSKALNAKFMESPLTTEEIKIAEELARWKYGSRGWNFRR